MGATLWYLVGFDTLLVTIDGQQISNAYSNPALYLHKRRSEISLILVWSKSETALISLGSNSEIVLILVWFCSEVCRWVGGGFGALI